MRIAKGTKSWLAFIVCLLGLCSTGCSLIGLGIGAAVPRWKRDVGTSYVETYPESRVAVYTAEDLPPVVGWYERTIKVDSGSYLVLETDDGRRTIPYVKAQRVDLRSGSHWDEGLAIGLVPDIAALIVAGWAITRLGYH